MAKTNKRTSAPKQKTHEGAPAFQHLTPPHALRRSVMSCLLWEDTFYEDGVAIADRIVNAARAVTPKQLADIAVEARKVMNLRHVPLLLLSVLCETGAGNGIVSDTIVKVISRADELAEFVAVYAKFNNVPPSQVKKKMSAQMKKGLARAFLKFDGYNLAKYNRDGAVKLRDVMFLCHPKPENAEQKTTFSLLAANKLPAPDTWEVALSAGADKKATFLRLLDEGNLGYFALLRNLRNMVEAGIDPAYLKKYVEEGKGREKILPFRYIAAARACPAMEPALDEAMKVSIKNLPVLTGRTIVLVDISPSMDAKLSAKSDMTRMMAAAALASVINGENVRVFPFADQVVEVPFRSGMAGVDGISNAPLNRNGTLLGKAIAKVNTIPHDRLIVITDEQSHDTVGAPKAEKAYMINVAPYQNGVGYGKEWLHLNGFSENVLRFIHELETQHG